MTSIKRFKDIHKMNIVYCDQEFPNTFGKSIFLAGPTPRENSPSWREDAIAILRELNYDGVVFVPEPKHKWPEYTKQIQWEDDALNMSDIILFWIPRNMNTLPGLTTNDEFGKWKTSGKVCLGTPLTAENVRYQEYYAKKLDIPLFHSLEECIKFCINLLLVPIQRTGAERFIPAKIFKLDQCQLYLQSLKKQGNRLEEARVEWCTPANNPFITVIWVKIWIAAEERYKDNEIVISRPDISSVVLLKRDKNNILNSSVVLIKEFRIAVRNSRSMVIEIPGGSAHTNIPEKQIAIEEVSEEIGITIDESRLKFLGSRQLASTLSSHHNNVYLVEITQKEEDLIKTKTLGKTFGIKEDTEQTVVEFHLIKDILQNDAIDWSNIGAILLACLYNGN